MYKGNELTMITCALTTVTTKHVQPCSHVSSQTEAWLWVREAVRLIYKVSELTLITNAHTTVTAMHVQPCSHVSLLAIAALCLPCRSERSSSAFT